MIRVVSFDLWETLLRRGNTTQSDAWRIKEFSLILHNHGYNIIQRELERAIQEVREYAFLQQREYGEQISTKEQVEQILHKLHIQQAELIDMLLAVHSSAALYAEPSVSPGAHATIREILKQGKKIALTCNTGATSASVLRKILDHNNLLPLLPVQFFSDELGFAKPRPQIFQTVATYFGVAPQEIIHIGDDWKTDVIGSRNAGCIAAWFRPSGMEVSENCLLVTDLTSLPPLISKLDHSLSQGDSLIW